MEFKIKHYQQLSSTNDELRALNNIEEVSEGSVILADFQSLGRGRADNTWHSEKGKNLLISILFNPDISVEQHFFLTEFISLAIIDTLENFLIPAKIKWPNDIFVEDQKIAGILIENTLMVDKVLSSIVGLGININQVGFPKNLPNAISTLNYLKYEIKPSQFLEKLLSNCALRYDQLKRGCYDAMHEAYSQKLYKKGQEIKVNLIAKNSLQKARLIGVEETGALLLSIDNGEVSSYLFGELKIIID